MIDKLTKDDLQGVRARQGSKVDSKVPIRKADLVLMRKINEVIEVANRLL